MNNFLTNYCNYETKQYIIFLIIIAGCVFPSHTTFADEIDGIEYRYDYDCYHVSGCSDDLEIANILSEVYGYPVTGIDSRAFLGCTSLTSVTLPNSLTGIGTEIFQGCTSLTGFFSFSNHLQPHNNHFHMLSI